MSEPRFPSGPWSGFYTYRPHDKHRMDLMLTFAEGRIDGGGSDDIGGFGVRGGYEAESMECWWTKTYLGAHSVFYRGVREGDGIWGRWEIGALDHGGFHIWPRGSGTGPAKRAAATEPLPAASSTPASVP